MDEQVEVLRTLLETLQLALVDPVSSENRDTLLHVTCKCIVQLEQFKRSLGRLERRANDDNLQPNATDDDDDDFKLSAREAEKRFNASLRCFDENNSKLASEFEAARRRTMDSRSKQVLRARFTLTPSSNRGAPEDLYPQLLREAGVHFGQCRDAQRRLIERLCVDERRMIDDALSRRHGWRERGDDKEPQQQQRQVDAFQRTPSSPLVNPFRRLKRAAAARREARLAQQQQDEPPVEKELGDSVGESKKKEDGEKDDDESKVDTTADNRKSGRFAVADFFRSIVGADDSDAGGDNGGDDGYENPVSWLFEKQLAKFRAGGNLFESLEDGARGLLRIPTPMGLMGVVASDVLLPPPSAEQSKATNNALATKSHDERFIKAVRDADEGIERARAALAALQQLYCEQRHPLGRGLAAVVRRWLQATQTMMATDMRGVARDRYARECIPALFAQLRQCFDKSIAAGRRRYPQLRSELDDEQQGDAILLDERDLSECFFSAVEVAIFRSAYPSVWQLYNTLYASQNARCARRTAELLECGGATPEAMGIRESFRLQQQQSTASSSSSAAEPMAGAASEDDDEIDEIVDELPYQPVIDALSLLSTGRSVSAKLQALVSASRLISECVRQHYAALDKQAPAVGADDFLPLFSYCLVHASILNVYSELQFVTDWMSESVVLGEQGYCLATFSTAVDQLCQHASSDDDDDES
jgi:Vacuolar sorting protein 9 (VPS9) domain